MWILGAKDLEELKQMEITDENLKIIQEYERLLESDSRFGLLYNVEKDQKRMISYYEQEGRKEGIKEEKITTAKKLLKMGIVTIEQIAEATELSIEEIKKLANKN